MESKFYGVGANLLSCASVTACGSRPLLSAYRNIQ